MIEHEELSDQVFGLVADDLPLFAGAIVVGTRADSLKQHAARARGARKRRLATQRKEQDHADGPSVARRAGAEEEIETPRGVLAR